MNDCFYGPFAALIQDFVNFKRSMGFKYRKESACLKQFSEFCINEGLQDPVLTKDLSDAWCHKRPYEQQRNGTDQRITCLRQFALYLVSIGYDAYIPLHLENRRSRKSRYVAYVFTHDIYQGFPWPC